MKICLFLILIFCLSAFATDFNKVTGTFDLDSSKSDKSAVGDTTQSGSFNHFEKERLPASVKEKKVYDHVTEITGTFK